MNVCTPSGDLELLFYILDVRTIFTIRFFSPSSNLYFVLRTDDVYEYAT